MEIEPVMRVGAFVGVFVILASWESLRPRRERALGRGRRWLSHGGLILADTLLVRLLFPAAAVGAALDASAQGWGLFNALGWPLWLELPISVALLDLAIWAQHLVTHKIPVLWRFHMVHHADRDMDVTTGLRFHPVEIALSMALKIGLVYVFGFAVAAVIAFEILLNACSMFTHTNGVLAPRSERALRRVMVTPDMHRTHHSVERREHDTNFGFCLSVWDRLFRTYTAEPEKGRDGVEIGLKPWRDAAPAGFLWTLLAPFRGRAP